MKLFDVVLKVIKTLMLISTDDHAILTRDVKEWESDATPDSKDKMKALYAKLHKGVFVRLLMPFFFYVVLNKMRNAMNPTSSDGLLDD